MNLLIEKSPRYMITSANKSKYLLTIISLHIINQKPEILEFQLNRHLTQVKIQRVQEIPMLRVFPTHINTIWQTKDNSINQNLKRSRKSNGGLKIMVGI